MRLLFRPRGLVFQNLLINFTARLMGPRKITGTHQKLPDNFPSGEPESRFEQLDPFFLAQRMMVIQPLPERPVFLLYGFYCFGIFYRGVDLEPVADDAGIGQQAIFLALAITGHFVDVEIVEGPEEIILFLQDGRPGKTGLVDFQDQPGEQVIVILNRKAIFIVMIMDVRIALLQGQDEGAITSQFFHGECR